VSPKQLHAEDLNRGTIVPVNPPLNDSIDTGINSPEEHFHRPAHGIAGSAVTITVGGVLDMLSVVNAFAFNPSMFVAEAPIW